MSTGIILGQPKEVETLEVLRGEITTLSEVALKQRALDTATKDAALAVGADVKRMRKAIEDRRKQITIPLDDLKKRVMAFAEALDAPLAKAEMHIRMEALRYQNEIAEQQRRAQALIDAEKLRIKREEEAKLRTAAFLNDDMGDQLAAQEQVRMETKAKQAEVAVQQREIKAQGVKGTSEHWVFEVTDPSQLPRQYLKVDESAIRQAVQYQHLREIPGVRIYKETRVRLG